MFHTENKTTTPPKSEEESHARKRKPPASASPVNYKSLNVIKRLSKAKFPVYLTTSNVDHAYYAMKVFPYKSEHSSQEEQPHPYYNNEARFSLLKHPNIIGIVHSEKEKDTLYKGSPKKVSYILMEYAPHGDFFDFVTKYKDKIDERLVRTYFRQLINGIEYLHSHRIAHLDLKPENLLLGADYNLKIADFDLSHKTGDDAIYSKGTRNFRGPEFFQSSSGDPDIKHPFSSDIYSAGIILFILKTGGIYPYAENNVLEGIDLVDLMHNNNSEFWKQHCSIQGKKSSFFDKDFKELFNAMVKCNPQERITLSEIKKSKWYNGPVYSPLELQKIMKKLLKN